MPDITENQVAAEPATSAPGEPVSSASAPAQPASFGSTDTLAATLSTAPASTPTSDATPKTVDGAPSTTAPVGAVGEQGNVSSTTSSSTDAPTSDGSSKTTQSEQSASTLGASVSTGEQGNAATAGADTNGSVAPVAATLSDSLAADAASRVLVVNTPSTDTQTGSPTGGPIAGRGDTPDAKAKHGVLDRIEEDLRAELHAIEGLPHYVLHILRAVFDRHRTHVDNQAQ